MSRQNHLSVSESDSGDCLPTSAEGLQLTRAFKRIADPKVRRHIIDLVSSLARETKEPPPRR